MDLEELEVDRSINPGELDVEATRQADLFFKWAERSVHARAELDRCKMELDTLQSKICLSIRAEPDKFGLSKPTEAAVTARVSSDDQYLKAYKRMLEAKRESALSDRAVESLEQKKRMLEVLITLHGQQYFAGPSVPRNLVEAWKEHQKGSEARVNSRQRDRLKKRVRVLD